MLCNQKLYNIKYIQEMTQLYKIDVRLSPNQKKKKNLAKAFHKRKTIVLRLSNIA